MATTLRLALVDAGEGRIGTFIDHIRLLCYGFDPAQGIYTSAIERWLMAGAAATVLFSPVGSFSWCGTHAGGRHDRLLRCARGLPLRERYRREVHLAYGADGASWASSSLFWLSCSPSVTGAARQQVAQRCRAGCNGTWRSAGRPPRCSPSCSFFGGRLPTSSPR